MKRTDVHRPSAINPADYEFVALGYQKCEGLGDIESIKYNRQVLEAHMKRTGGWYSQHEHGGNCMVCGCVNMVYSIIYYHAKTNSYVRVGQDCADKMDMSGNFDIDAFKRSINDALEARAGKRKAQAILAEKGLQDAWKYYEMSYDEMPEDETRPRYEYDYDADTNTETKKQVGFWKLRQPEIIRDIVSKLVKYGSVSDKALDYVGQLLKQIADRPAILAQRAAEKEAAAPCPTGRVTVTGTVLKVEERDSDWGTTTKLTIKAREGFIVWVSKPAYMKAERGQEVTLKMTLTPSDKDPKFGFGKRPMEVSNG